jgi:hypothetical protein
MRRIFLLCTIAAMFASLSAQATMAPQYERPREWAIVFHHLDEIAKKLGDPIDKIEFVKGGARVVADKCFVLVKLDYKNELDSGGVPMPGSGYYTETVGEKKCP